jgi:DNA-binding CsgD family transcriptional regulator
MRGKGPASRLLDRAAELTVISGILESACASSGSALLIEGAAGIGKTSLLAYACDRARDAGMTVLAARSAEFESGYAWGIVRQLFEAQTAGPGLDSAGDAAALASAALRPGEQPGDDPFSVLHGLYWLTAAIAQRAPVLLAVDDLHWADQPSLRFVGHLARRLDGLPVAVVLTVREPRSGTVHEKALTAGLAAEDGMTVLRPPALGRSACAEFIREGLGGQPSAAFEAGCHELTRGNPLLLRALMTSLIAEGITGQDADVPHLRRLTPGTVSRSVLLRLGRMPAAALASARAIAVLGTAATIARAAQLAELDGDACAEAVAGLMAEDLIEGDHALGFVHPLVRSAVYEDLAAPIRQRWHARAARMLDREGAAPEEVTVHLLAAAATADGWVVSKLRDAAADARRRGAADVALLCLHRALAEPPAADARADVLFALGTLEIMLDPAAAVGHLGEALADTASWPGRGEIALALAEALALGGQFEAGVDLLTRASAEAPDETSREALQAALFNTARMDLGTRAVTEPLLEHVQARTRRGEHLGPQLTANLAIELAGAGRDRVAAVRSARDALTEIPLLMSVSAAALPETISVLLFADEAVEAKAAAEEWLQLARQQGSLPIAAVAEGFSSLVALYAGEISDAVAYGLVGMAGTPNIWISTIVTSFVVRALIDRGEIDQARALLTAGGLVGDLFPSWPHNLIRHARGCLSAAAGDHHAAVRDLLEAGEHAQRWSIPNPAILPWRSDAALSLAAIGEQDRAGQLAATEVTLAREWGAGRALGIALRAAGLVGPHEHGIELLAEAVTVLRASPAPLELGRALVDLGSAQRRSGARIKARDTLREGLDLAYRQGGLRLAEQARRELVIAGGKPRRDAIRGRDALTPSELRVAELAAAGQTNRQIAQALFITQRTVENHLTSSYAKLGIGSRSDLAGSLAGHREAAGSGQRRA